MTPISEKDTPTIVNGTVRWDGLKYGKPPEVPTPGNENSEPGEPPTRGFLRHPSDIPIHCRIARSPSRRNRLKNISAGGLCFETPEAIQRGCVIQITIPIREPAFAVMGTIAWCRPLKNCYEVGVQFADASTEFAVRMVEQVCQIHRYQREVLEREGRALSGADAAAEWVTKYARDFSW